MKRALGDDEDGLDVAEVDNDDDGLRRMGMIDVMHVRDRALQRAEVGRLDALIRVFIRDTRFNYNRYLYVYWI